MPPAGDPAPPGDTIDAWLGKLPLRTSDKGDPPHGGPPHEGIEIFGGFGPGRPGEGEGPGPGELSYDFLKFPGDGLGLDKSDVYVKFQVQEEPQYHYPHLNEPLPTG